ncbi:helix-turn-helix domain-containing protein [Tardiphaga sp. 11_C7_N12_6]|uniref:helix-turn-helix domain-containing protein n=1 Tax=Tardiphaga sp. 11_C7_N12_6 TaxID=3240789 RepID=UPI003F217669
MADDLRIRFGRLLALHRRRCGLTQDELAEAAELSVDMISKIEVGATGARFPSIERLATAVGVDPAELFTHHVPDGVMASGKFGEISSKLASLSEADLVWIGNLLDVALAGPKMATAPKPERSIAKPTKKHSASSRTAKRRRF